MDAMVLYGMYKRKHAIYGKHVPGYFDLPEEEKRIWRLMASELKYS